MPEKSQAKASKRRQKCSISKKVVLCVTSTLTNMSPPYSRNAGYASHDQF